MLVVDWRCRACEIVDLVHFNFEWIGYVMPDELKVIVWEQMTDVFFVAGEEIVEANDFVALLNESVTKMAAEESGSTCY